MSENRVVISVAGGVAEEIASLAVGNTEVIVVDFDNLEAASADGLQTELENLPEDVKQWVQTQL